MEDRIFETDELSSHAFAGSPCNVRKGRRVTGDSVIFYHADDAEHEVPLKTCTPKTCRSINISETGIALISDEPMENGFIYRMKVQLDEKRAPLELKGRVAETRMVDGGCCVGIDFIEIPDDNLQIIRDFIKEQMYKGL